MSGVNKRPIFWTQAESEWYERTPKRVLFAIARDYAEVTVGESEAIEDVTLVLAELNRVAQIVQDSGLDGS